MLVLTVMQYTAMLYVNPDIMTQDNGLSGLDWWR